LQYRYKCVTLQKIMIMKQEEDILMLPNGISDFRKVRMGGYCYVDKTMYLNDLERAGSYLFFVRPRRFGKSLFISMMKDYYDCLNASNFQEEFKGLAVAKKPTKWQGKFQIIHFDFSMVAGMAGNTIEEKFNTYCCGVLDKFIRDYADYYTPEIVNAVLAEKGQGEKLLAITREAKTLHHLIYLIVDEYDNFTNTILSNDKDRYGKLTHDEGYYRTVFKLYKPNFDRIIMFGVSPVTLNDITSSYNIPTNISARTAFNGLLGFSEVEIKKIISYYRKSGLIKNSTKDIMNDMRPWYDNYCFTKNAFKDGNGIYNPYMVLNYLDTLIKEGTAPENMVVSNTATDITKLQQIIDIDINNSHFGNSQLQKIVLDGYVYDSLYADFDALKMTRDEYFSSVLYYQGMLTIGGARGERLKLIIPNLNARAQYYDYMRYMYNSRDHLRISDLKDVLEGAAYDGKWQSLIEFLGSHYKNDSSIRDAIEGERHLQGYFLAYLKLTSLFITWPEMELNHGYGDFFLFANTKKYPDAKHSYIIELKYLQKGKSQAEADAQIEEATAQLRRYAADKDVRALTAGTNLHLIAVQMRGEELVKYISVED